MFDRYTKVVEAEFPRLMMHATIPMGAPLAVVFDHYRLRKDRVSEFRRHVNLFFLSGTGMTKAVWRYHIKKLFEYSEGHEDLPWQIVNVVAIDNVNHGDSAVENEGVLGWEYDWREGAHDLIQVAKSLRLVGDNVVIGHSMGGFQAMYSTLISPMMFKFVIAMEPVTHGNKFQAEIFSKKLLKSLNGVIQTEFKNEKEYELYMRTKSFYKKFPSKVLDEFIKSEKIVHKDGSVSAKTSKQSQMICYHAGLRIFPRGLDFIRSVERPIVYAIGEKATWNPKESTKEVSTAIRYGETIVVPNGEHLFNGELPDATVEIIIKSLSKYVEKGPAAKSEPVSRDRYAQIFRENYALLEESFLKPKQKL